MFTRRVRFFIIIVDIVGALVCWRFDMPMITGLLLVSALLIAWGHFRNGTVYLVGRALKQQKLEKAARLMEEIRYPDRLSRMQKGYYYFHEGVLHLHANRLGAAKASFDTALEIGMRTPSDEAAIYINLGVIAVKEGDKKRGRQMLAKAKALKFRPHLRTSMAILERYVN